jgi:hypothetical protein
LVSVIAVEVSAMGVVIGMVMDSRQSEGCKHACTRINLQAQGFAIKTIAACAQNMRATT